MSGEELFRILEACGIDRPYMEPLDDEFQAGTAGVGYDRVTLDGRFDLEKAATLITERNSRGVPL